MRKLFMAAALLLATPALASVGPHVVRMDPGGLVFERQREVDARRAARQPVVIDGVCNSACTMYLSLPGTCITHNASMLFHDAFDPARGNALVPAFTNVVMRHYPAALRAYLAQRGFVPGSGVEVTLSYSELARFVRTCA